MALIQAAVLDSGDSPQTFTPSLTIIDPNMLLNIT